MSIPSHPFNAQHDIHPSIGGLKKFNYIQGNVSIVGSIDWNYSFEATISAKGKSQTVAGNGLSGYDANIRLGVAFGNLRFSLAADNTLFLVRGTLFSLEGESVRIDTVLVDALAWSTSKTIHHSRMHLLILI